MSYEGAGFYRHYKGGNYRAAGIGRHESTNKLLVVYNSLDLDHELERLTTGVDFVLRPLNPEDGDDSWNSKALVFDRETDPGYTHTTQVERFTPLVVRRR